MDLTFGHGRDHKVEGLLGNPVQLLDIEQRPLTDCFGQGSVDEDVWRVSVGQHAGRIELASQPGWRELGVALDEHERHLGLSGESAQQCRFPSARWSIEQHVALGCQGRNEDLCFSSPPDDGLADGIDNGCVVLQQVQPSANIKRRGRR